MTMFRLYEEVIPYGEHYDFLADKDAETSLESALVLNEILKDREGETTRDQLAQALCGVIGVRKAERLAQEKPAIINEALREETIRRANAKAKLETLIKKAAEKAAKKYPEDFAIQEVRRDSYYYVGVRSGLIAIYNALTGAQITPESFSEDLLNGKNLSEIIRDTRFFDVSRVLPNAIIYSQSRLRLDQSLREKGISNEERNRIMDVVPYAPNVGYAIQVVSKVLGIKNNIVQDTLLKCFTAYGSFKKQFEKFAEIIGVPLERKEEFKEIVLNAIKGVVSNLQIARALRELDRNQSVDYVLPNNYRKILWLYALAQDITDNFELKVYPGQRVHTSAARKVSQLYGMYLRGVTGIPRSLMLFLYERSDMDFRHTVTGWSMMGGNKILYPMPEISYMVLGTLFGTFFLGRTTRTRNPINIFTYSLKRRNLTEVLDILESVGQLERKPQPQQYFIDSEQLATAFGITGHSDERRTYKSEIIHLPSQTANIIDMSVDNIDAYSENVDFCRAALKGWLQERSMKYTQPYGISSAFTIEPRAGFKLSQEYAIRKLASKIGLNISEGVALGNTRARIVFVNNPEIVGFYR